VHQHQGTIEVDSRKGYTCFTITLPLQDDAKKNRGEKQ
jgi:signal transduction histidine kinase